MNSSTVFVGLCKDCGREMVQQRVWALRPDLHEGRARVGGHGMCNGCYGRARRAGTLPDPAPRRVEVPDVAVVSSYPVVCAECGLIGSPVHRDAAVRLRDGHVDEHRAELGLPVRVRGLSNEEVAHLRRLVGATGSAA